MISSLVGDRTPNQVWLWIICYAFLHSVVEVKRFIGIVDTVQLDARLEAFMRAHYVLFRYVTVVSCRNPRENQTAANKSFKSCLFYFVVIGNWNRRRNSTVGFRAISLFSISLYNNLPFLLKGVHCYSFMLQSVILSRFR